ITHPLFQSDPYPARYDPKRSRRGYFPNEIRKTSFWFCRDAVHYFLRENDLDLIVRGHEMMEDGYAFRFDKKLLTIFSAPQYCQANNDAAVLKVYKNLNCQVCVFIFKRPPPRMTLQQISSFIKIEPLSKIAPVTRPSSPSEFKTPSSAPSLAGPGNIKFTLYVPDDPANEVTLREKVTPMFNVPSNEVVEKLVRAKQQKKVTIQEDIIAAVEQAKKNFTAEDTVTAAEKKRNTVEKIVVNAKAEKKEISTDKKQEDSESIQKVPDK
uniref:Serine/threonine specific protein phosphatases domain-containing protein n=1 Tax=Romanomermis culicivorax TaxID=13658 RepID=A0A915KC02_ROMCU